MAVGVFGKLPARRDYVQHDMDPVLMGMLDPWLQDAVAQSRTHLGEAWLETYLQSPVWRFWLGHRIAGKPVLGMLMPSVDGVGRYFPLVIAGAFETSVPPPEFHAHDEWFDPVEALILATLNDDATYEALLGGIAEVPHPDVEVALPQDDTDIRRVFLGHRISYMNELCGHLSYWWVPAREDNENPPRAMTRRGLPSPAEYAMMLSNDQQGHLAPVVGGV